MTDRTTIRAEVQRKSNHFADMYCRDPQVRHREMRDLHDDLLAFIDALPAASEEPSEAAVLAFLRAHPDPGSVLDKAKWARWADPTLLDARGQLLGEIGEWSSNGCCASGHRPWFLAKSCPDYLNRKAAVDWLFAEAKAAGWHIAAKSEGEG